MKNTGPSPETVIRSAILWHYADAVMPDDGDPVIVSISLPTLTYKHVSIALRSNGRWFNADGSPRPKGLTIVHWASLPDAPKA